MDLLDIAKKVADGLISEVVSKNSFSNISVGKSGKTVEQWDKEWICIGPLCWSLSTCREWQDNVCWSRNRVI